TARRAHARDAFEAALIAAAFAARRVEPRAVRAGMFARAAAPGLSAEAQDAGQAIAQAQALETEVTEEQSVLADAQAAIDAERAELVTLAARRRAAQAQFAEDAAA